MADKANASPGAGAAPTADSPAAIRNVVLIGPSGGGKTTLVEALLTATGVLTRPGSVVDGTTVCDSDEAEISQQRSVGLALAPLSHNGVKVNLIDTPGYADFVGELRAGLRAADCALFVIAANEGVDELTKSLWLECQQVGMPRAVVITKLDHPRANYDSALAAAQDAFGDKVLPLYLPANSPCTGLIGLLSQTHYEYSDGKRSTHGARLFLRRPDLRAARHADRGNHRGVRGRDADGALPRRRRNRREGADRGSGEGGGPRLLLPGDPGVQRHRRRNTGAAGGRDQRLPVSSRASVARCVHSAGQGPRQHQLRPRRTAAGRGGQDDVGPLRRQGQPGPGFLRDHQARRDRSRVGPFCVVLREATAPASATRITTRTNGSARCRSPSASSSDRRAPWWQATSARSAGCPAPKPGTPCRTRPIRWFSSRGRCPSRCCRSPCSRGPSPTTTSCRSGCSDWRPKTRRCGSSRTRRPTRSCCGAWARPTRASCSTGWPTGSA